MTNPFAVWAPDPDEVELIIAAAGEEHAHEMTPAEGGWWVPKDASISGAPGTRYGYRLRKGRNWSKPVPDPRTTSQPDGVHGLSEISSTDFTWTDDAWKGIELKDMVIYELHVGTFTPSGTFDGVIEKLDYLVDLGVNTIELMPVQPFAGARNWGYDGVTWHAVHAAYGGREGLKRLVDAAHNKGVAVILDVVYNHFGPDGNYNGMFGPYTAGGNTGWGELVNFSNPQSDEVRSYVLDAVDQWLAEFRIDGLRLDAVHSFDDRLAYSIMEQMQGVADEVATESGFPRVLIAESDMNDPRLLYPQEIGGYGLAGQWVDDIHHALHTVVSGEDHAYYEDFGTIDVLVDTMNNGWFFTNTYSSYRGRTHGKAIDQDYLAPWQLVTYTTTHDQTGNRASGDRPSMNLSPEQQVLKAAVIYLSPFTPMLFMGEEFSAQTPFPFFCSHSDDHLNHATAEGRKNEFSRMGWNHDDIPHPADPETFASAKLDWDFTEEQQRVHTAYRRLLELRREVVGGVDNYPENPVVGGDGWIYYTIGGYTLVANLSAQEQTVPVGGDNVYSFTEPVAITAAESILPAWGFAVLKN